MPPTAPPKPLTPLVLRLLTAAVAAAVLVIAVRSCDNGSEPARPGSIDIEYVGNPNGVYRARCSPVSEAPDGHIVEIHPGDSIIDATYEYLPDGLKVEVPESTDVSYDCHDYTVEPALTEPETTPATAATTTSAVPPCDRRALSWPLRMTL